MFSYVIKYVLPVDQKRFCHQSQHCSLLFLEPESKSLVTFDVHLQIIKIKVFILPKNRDQLGGLNIGFVYIFLVLINIYPS